MIAVFVSHSSQDSALAEQLVDLLRAALNIRASEIRCTSVNGYRLPVGAHSDEQLRQEVFEARAFLGILSPSSLVSAYVLFELGARWGAKKHLAPLLAPGLTSHALKGPIAGLNALSCESASQLHQLVQDLGKLLDIAPEAPQAYQTKIDALMYFGAAISAPIGPQVPPPASSTTSRAAIPSPVAAPNNENEYPDADAIIRHHCEKEWPDDFNMRAYCIEQQRSSLAELKQGGPASIPGATFNSIRRKCAAEWPDDYQMRVYCESQQIGGYLKVNGK